MDRMSIIIDNPMDRGLYHIARLYNDVYWNKETKEILLENEVTGSTKIIGSAENILPACDILVEMFENIELD